MSADWSKPTVTSGYTNWPAEVKDRDADLAVGLDPAVVTPTNLPTNAIRWNSANARWEKYNGTTWAVLAASYAISISGNAATATAVAWSGVSGKPTTRDGYGITDVPKTDGTGASGTWSIAISGVAATAAAVAWSGVSGKPTTRDGYGITDVPKTDGTGASGTWSINVSGSAGSVAWGNVASKPFNYTGQSGQPSWLWGTNDGANYYVWNPSNFSVAYAANAGYATSAGNGGVTSVNGSTGAVTISGPTTANVLSATAGASVGAVGTYAMLYSWVGYNTNPGDTIAGSNLKYSFGANGGGYGGALSGTWRAMNRTYYNGGGTLDDYAMATGLFLRIS